MIDVEVISLTQKSRLHGKVTSIHLDEDSLSVVRGNGGGSEVYELRVVQVTCGNPHIQGTPLRQTIE
jgi:hypothetical protein